MTAYPTPRPVPATIARPEYVPRDFFDAGWGDHEKAPEAPVLSREDSRIRGDTAREGVRRAGKLAAEVLKLAGVTTDELDAIVHRLIVERGAYPSPLGYSSFPRSCTTSVNNVIAHGIPDDRPLDPSDLINIDITLFHNGYHGDTSKTFALPLVDNAGRELVEATQEALELGVKACGPGMPLNGIGEAIQDFAEREGFSVNQQFSGHGIGRRFHHEPWILHHRNSDKTAMEIGDCFTIEPILLHGPNSRGFMWEDGWTLSSETTARSAQFEHQILITSDGPEVLTR